MSTKDQGLNQEILLRIMLQAYQLGVQQKDIDLGTMIDTLTYALKPYVQPAPGQQGGTDHNRRKRKEAAV